MAKVRPVLGLLTANRVNFGLGMFLAFFLDIGHPTGDGKGAVGLRIPENTFKGIDT